jgi:hypothetical protein
MQFVTVMTYLLTVVGVVQEWRRVMLAQLKQEQEAREVELRQEMTRQRDEQIKLVQAAPGSCCLAAP